MKSLITQQTGLPRSLRNSISLNENGGFRSPGAAFFHAVMLLGSASASALIPDVESPKQMTVARISAGLFLQAEFMT
ncbi:hypothetical protein ABDK75_15585 [Gluconobacter sp. OJA]|uniref:hypothetical protein n=1 Tax=Gluconobacter sp. OJA TaxID=3145197 RepID=UPI0031F8F659